MHKQAKKEKQFEDLKQIFEAKLKTSVEWNSSISYAEHANQKGDIVPLSAAREHWEHLINSHASLMACKNALNRICKLSKLNAPPQVIINEIELGDKAIAAFESSQKP